MVPTTLAMPTAHLNAVMVSSKSEKNVTMVLETPTTLMPPAEPTAEDPDVVMVSLIPLLESNAIPSTPKTPPTPS